MENASKETYEEIISKLITHLTERFSRTERTFRYYKRCWGKVKSYMDSQNICDIDSTVCRNYILKEFKGSDFSKLTKRQKEVIGTLHILIEFLETGEIQIKKEQINLNGPIGILMTKYLASKVDQRLSTKTVSIYERHLSRFLYFLKNNNIEVITSLCLLHVLKYIKSISPRTVCSAHASIQVLKDLFRYLYTKRILETDFSLMIPRSNYKSQPKIPSIYTKEEVEKLIVSVDRNNSVGKRNYAIILLAARLGLRASDIANLKFENVQWNQNTIRLVQYKTGKGIELPLLPEVGNAIIDYLKYSRQNSDEAFVFLTVRSPIIPLTAVGVQSLVQHTFTKAHIDTKNRRHGPHALRHTLAGRLLERQTVLPVIAEVLGHENTESTKFYIRVDLNSMRQCALFVPPILASFYNQKEVSSMNKNQPWGIYAPYIRQFIDLKRGLGFKYIAEEYIYKRFDRFTIERGEKEVGISKELADKWCERWNNESNSFRIHRCLCISQLSSYLCKLGIYSYIPRIPRKEPTFTPYIFSEKEMTAIFNAADGLVMPRRIMSSVIFIVPSLLRLLYSSGLRIGEALSLQNKDFNLIENYILINDSKNGKQRMIPISESLSAVCQEYIHYRRKLPVPQADDNPFFISLNGSACLQHTFYRYFRIVLEVAGIPFKGNGHGPRIHDLRHSFAVASLAKMAEAGIDLYASLPILSAYLGHHSINSTNTYVRLTAEIYPRLLKDVDMVCLNVFPNLKNVESYEAD